MNECCNYSHQRTKCSNKIGGIQKYLSMIIQLETTTSKTKYLPNFKESK